MNYVIYVLEVEKISPFSIALSQTSGFIKEIKVSLTQKENQLTDEMSIMFILEEKLPSDEQIIKITKEKTEDIINLLFITLKGRFGIPEFQSLNVDGRIRAAGKITLFNVNTEDIPSNLTQILEGGLNDSIKLDGLRNSPVHRQFRAALRVEDLTTRFMFLYATLLASTTKGLQSEVDKLICSEEPQVQEVQSTKPWASAGDTETIYTWLRNQIGHTKSTTDLLSVETQVKNVCDKFTEIVKNIIS